DKDAVTTLHLVANPDILKTIAGHAAPRRPRLVVGFAAETHDVPRLAREKRLRKGCDWIVANDVSGDAMGGEENAAMIIRPDGETVIARAAKSEVARRLVDEISVFIKR
ncbi:MAG: phosphopantothenoylcysteine decarboxylase, partial [Oceanicaulis sp.]